MGRWSLAIAVFIERLYRKSTDVWHEIFSKGKEKKASRPLVHNGNFSSCSEFIIECKIKFLGPHQLIPSSVALREQLITRQLSTLHIQLEDKRNAEDTTGKKFP